MSGEMIAIVAVGVALAGVILTSLKGTETRLREDMKQLSERVARVEHSQAKPSQAGRAAGRIARGHQRAGQGQLGTSAACSLCEKPSFPNRSARYWE